ncbi:MAG: membrane protein insertion efficiency factor YidD [Phycisphaeraceae bacterium]|nr:MAG: membrane protein insertion efficiency factor YidD [Phycisphaeraceae bacterium]
MSRAGFFGRPTLHPLARAGNIPFVLIIKVYQVTLSPWLGRQCRYHPTCSWYALEAYRSHGPAAGTWLTVRRLSRCHPCSRGGYDPVPPRE